MNGSEIYEPEACLGKTGVSGKIRVQSTYLACLFLILFGACLLQFLPYPQAKGSGRNIILEEYIPPTPDGWRSKDHPLGETEAVSGAVKKILNYDEALLRTYQKAGFEFSIYVAYWRAGKMSAREIAFHIPDKCWVAAGWKRLSANYHYQKVFEGRPLAPAQAREFEAGGTRQFVIYWHIFNDRTIIYNPDGSPSDLSVLDDIVHRGLRQKGEQYFIRISSPAPLDSLWNDEGFQEVMEQIALLGPGLSSTAENFESSAAK
jgi:hypothetical protein